ncbi:MAG: glycine betaine/L-proline ABC transporter ATP-binding protein [Burkholderia sp.]
MTPNLSFTPSDALRSGPGIAQGPSSARSVPMAATEILSVRNLSKVFGAKPERALEMLRQGCGRNEIFEQTGNMVAVNDVSLGVRSGEIFVIMGLSGSGKSTLVRLLNRLIEPTAGQVILEGRDIAPMSEPELRKVRREKMAMVFQSFALLPNRSVLDNIAYGLEVAGMNKASRYEVARTALTRVGLGAYEKLLPGELSGGMQQRVGLARALAVNPSVLLMDEAFSALDPMIRFEMQNELLRLQKEEQRTIVFISHDIEEAIKIGGRIGIMKDGCLIQVGTPAELIQSPADAYVRDFFRNVDVSRFLNAATLMTPADRRAVIRHADTPSDRFLDTLLDAGLECGYVCDEAGHYRGVVTAASLRHAGTKPVRDALVADIAALPADADLQRLSSVALEQAHDVPVIDLAGQFAGTVSCRTILKHLMERKAA